uniref:Uncharacterized protein n=1 Tax=Phasianus colchicus TaxID=9054 RepID=A0A669QDN2_PHACC
MGLRDGALGYGIIGMRLWDMGSLGWDRWDGIVGMGFWDGTLGYGIIGMGSLGWDRWDGIDGIVGMGSLGFPAVLEILELIQRRDLVAADEQIIALEAECSAMASLPSPPPSSSSPSSPSSPSCRQTRDVALLYDALLAQLWAVVGESVPSGRPYPLLRSVVRVLEQEEAADARHPFGIPGRPRGLRRRWEEAVGRAAVERLGQVVVGGGLGPRLAALAGRAVGDLGMARCHVVPVYPAGYDAFGVYAKGYHRALAQQLVALAQRPLAVPELYLLLDWHSNTYTR